MRTATVAPGAVLIGIGLTVLGVLSASVSNVMQATRALRARPIVAMLAWGMFYGTLANALFALVLYGPPVVEYRGSATGSASSISACSPRRSAFTFYFGILRAVGARARGLFEPARADHRHGLLDRFRRIIAGRRWPSPAARWRCRPVHRAPPRGGGKPDLQRSQLSWQRTRVRRPARTKAPARCRARPLPT
jgi:hypothetical protein